MEDVKVGDLVQAYDSKGEPIDGTVVSIEPAKRVRPADYWNLSDKERKETYPVALVGFDTGGQKKFSTDELDPQDSEIEREFREAVPNGLRQIKKKLEKAEAALQEAVDLSEELGIPFRAGISFLSQSYFPTSLREKFGDIEYQFVSDVSGAWTQWGMDGGGWEHSAVC